MISVIVPMYNACNTIERCLLSVMNQSYHDLEIIIIDDGSSDGGQKIVKELAKNDERIKYYWQENHGVSNARNHGINVSNGEYICFLDSDDAITEDYIRLLFNSLNEMQCDIAMCGYREVIADNKIDHIISEEENNSLQGLLQTDLYVLRYFMFSPGMKIYRADLINQLQLRFREDMVLAEDQLFNYHYYELCKTIAFVNQPNYIYFRDDSSLSKVTNIQCYHNELENLSYEIAFMERNQIEKSDQIIAEYICYLVRRYIFIPNEKNTRSEAIDRLKKINLYKKSVKLSYQKDNRIYQLMCRKLFNIIYLYKKISMMIHHQ